MSGARCGRTVTAWPRTRRVRLLMVAGALVVVVVGVVLAVVQPFASRSSALSLPLARAALVDLPGNSTRFDYADIDPAAHRLAVAHLGDDALLILDTRTNSVVATVSDVAHATGVIIVPSLHRVFASAPGSGEVLVIDEESGAVLARAPAGRYPDGLTYVPSTGQVWVSDQSGGVETVIDAGTGRRVATVDLGGDAGNVRYDPAGDRVLVAVQTRNEIAVIDPHTRTVERRVAVPGCDHDHGLLVAGGRAFVACDGNSVLVTLDLPDLRPLGQAQVGDDPDVLAVDESRGLLYVAAESGVVTTVDISTPAGRVTGRAHLADNAHVVAVDPSTGRAYFPLQDAGDGSPRLLVTEPAPQ